MTLPPLFVTVSTKRRACVLDTDLALSRFGLLLASRLCEEFDLWLVPELWHILDNLEVYPEVPGVQEAGGLRGRGVGWRQWELARLDKDLAGLNVFWMGDEKCESLLPKGADTNLLQRFRCLDQSLLTIACTKGKRGLHLAPDYDFFGECFRQMVSLTASLTAYHGFILTQQSPPLGDEPEPEPAICACLKDWGINCFKVHCDKQTQIEKEYLLPILARTGISELLWAGLRLAVVHLVAPNALLISASKEEDEKLSTEFATSPEDKQPDSLNWWEGAVSFWYPVKFA